MSIYPNNGNLLYGGLQQVHSLEIENLNKADIKLTDGSTDVSFKKDSCLFSRFFDLFLQTHLVNYL